jgi:hypothetical protein
MANEMLPETKKPTAAALAKAVAFFLLCGGYLTWLAITRAQPLDLLGFIPLSVEGAKIFFGIMAGLSFGLVLLALGQLIYLAAKKRNEKP